MFIHCVSPVEVTWTFQGGPLPSNVVTGTTISKNGYLNYLKIDDVRLDNAGIYTCTGEVNEDIIFKDDGVILVKGILQLLNS